MHLIGRRYKLGEAINTSTSRGVDMLHAYGSHIVVVHFRSDPVRQRERELPAAEERGRERCCDRSGRSSGSSGRSPWHLQRSPGREEGLHQTGHGARVCVCLCVMFLFVCLLIFFVMFFFVIKKYSFQYVVIVLYVVKDPHENEIPNKDI